MATHKKMINLLVLSGEAGHGDDREFSLSELATEVGCTYSRAREVVQELIDEGHVVKVKRGEYVPTKTFELVELPDRELVGA